MLGDTNADYIRFPIEIINLTRNTNFTIPSFLNEDDVYSYSATSNNLVGKDGSAVESNCLNSYDHNLTNDVRTKAQIDVRTINPYTQTDEEFNYDPLNILKVRKYEHQIEDN